MGNGYLALILGPRQVGPAGRSRQVPIVEHRRVDAKSEDPDVHTGPGAAVVLVLAGKSRRASWPVLLEEGLAAGIDVAVYRPAPPHRELLVVFVRPQTAQSS